MWTTERFPALWLLPVLAAGRRLHDLSGRARAVDQPAPGDAALPRGGLGRARQLRERHHRRVFRRGAEELAALHAVRGAARRGHRHRRPRCSSTATSSASTALRSIVLLPWVLPGAISAVLWVWVFHPSWGIINSLLCKLGLIDRSIPWLTDPRPRLRLGDRRACLDADPLHRRPDDGGALDAQPGD